MGYVNVSEYLGGLGVSPKTGICVRRNGLCLSSVPKLTLSSPWVEVDCNGEMACGNLTVLLVKNI
jgi:hypothetical protein